MSSYESSDEEYDVERIVDHRGNGRARQYLVKWVGYDHENNTWEPQKNLKTAQKVIQAYLDTLQSNPSKATTKKPTRKSTRVHSDDEDHEVISLSNDDDDDDDDDDDHDKDDDDDDDLPVTRHGALKRVLRGKSKALAEDDEEDWSAASKKKRLRTKSPQPTIIDDDNDVHEASGDDSSENDDEGDGNSVVDLKRYGLKAKIDGVERNFDVIDDTNHPAPTVDWNKNVKNVTLVFREGKPTVIRALLEWKNGEYSVHDISKLHKNCPLILLKYYEKFVSFADDVKVTEK